MSYSEMSESCSIAVLANHLEPIVHKYNTYSAAQEERRDEEKRRKINFIEQIIIIVQYVYFGPPIIWPSFHFISSCVNPTSQKQYKLYKYGSETVFTTHKATGLVYREIWQKSPQDYLPCNLHPYCEKP